MNNGKWREFEAFAASIQKELAPDAQVRTNVQLKGKRSGIDRQIDILVEETIGQYKIRIVIDCKDYKTPVDVKDVETFIGLVEDVGANKGALIAASGFSSAAKQRGADAGIDLYRLVDAQNTKWRSYVSIPAVMCDHQIASYSFALRGTGPVAFESQDIRFMMLFDAQGNRIDCLHNLVVDLWGKNIIPRSSGQYKEISVCEGDTYVQTRGQLYKIDVLVNVHVEELLYFGQLPLSEIKGFANEVTKELHTTGFLTAPINPHEVEQGWKKIESLEQLAVKPSIVFHVISTHAKVEKQKDGQ